MKRTSQPQRPPRARRVAGKPKTFHIRLARTERRCLVVEVEARAPRQAKMMAMERAGSLDFYDGSCGEPEYGVTEVHELEGGS